MRGFIAQRPVAGGSGVDRRVGLHGAKDHLVTFSRVMTESTWPDTLSLMFAMIL